MDASDLYWGASPERSRKDSMAPDEKSPTGHAAPGGCLEMGMRLFERIEISIYREDRLHGEPHWFTVSRNFRNGTEHFNEWKRFRSIMERVRVALDGERGFMT